MGQIQFRNCISTLKGIKRVYKSGYIKDVLKRASEKVSPGKSIKVKPENGRDMISRQLFYQEFY